MENKINIAELLKDCPEGMELDCTMYDDTFFYEITDDPIFPIRIKRIDGCSITLTKYGQYTNANFAKCVIFPKGKTTWEGFTPPCQFKDGDVVISSLGNIHILKNCSTSYIYVDFAHNSKGNLCKSLTTCVNAIRLATEEEKAKLFQVIKDNGYRWDEESKTLETLPKFKDGDILAIDDTIFIYNGMEELSPFPSYYVYVIADKNGFFAINTSTKKYGARFATEEEKNILFEAIKNNGYKWYPDTKTLEKLIEPVFKAGDKISLKCEDVYWDIKTIEDDWYICTNGAKIHIGEQHHYELVPVEPKFKVGDKIKHKENTRWVCTITRVTDRYYVDGHPTCYTVLFDKQDEYELVPNKFDINTLKPFESKVLVRSSKESLWKPAIFGYYLENACYPYYVLGGTCWNQCIPYEENEHLLGTTNDCLDYYKIRST